MKQRKQFQLSKRQGTGGSALSRRLAYMLLLLVTFFAGGSSAWAEDVTFSLYNSGNKVFPSVAESGIILTTSSTSFSGSSADNGYCSIANNNTVTITPESGKTITEVVFTHTEKNSNRITSWTLGDTTQDAAEVVTFEGLSATSACVFTAGGSARLKSVTVTYTTSSDPDPTPAPKYTLTFGVNPTGAASISAVLDGTSTSIQSGDSFEEGTKITITPSSANPGYTRILGANAAWTGSNNTETNEITWTMGTSNKTLTANFRGNVITFNTDGGNTIDPKTYAGSAIELPTPTKDGYTFDGWYNGDTKITETSYTPLTDVTLTAHWTEVPSVVQYTAPTITVDGNWMTVSQPEGQGATMFWKYTRTKAGDISDTNHDAGDGTTEDSKGFFIPYGKYPADFIQAICVDITNPTGEGSRTSEITKYGKTITVNPPQPTVAMNGTNKVLFTMNGQITSCYFEYKIGESGETHQVFNTTSHEIDITSGEKIYVWVSASYKHKDEGEEKTGYVGCDPVEFTPTYTPSVVFEITGQPASANYNYNATATALSVVATSANELTYQWYSNTEDNNTNGTAIDGATESTYTPATTAVGTTYYYCVVTEETTNATLTSATAKVEVIVPKPGVSVHENIVTISGPVAGATYYYTLDKSDPATSTTRIEYAPDAVAIRENITKIRAVAYIDGNYSAIQGVDIKTGTSVQYEPVTVLEARGKGISAGDTFTGNTCTTSINISNGDAETSYTNAKSPNSLIDVAEKIYRGETKSSQITVGLNSTSAKKFVVGFVSNASNERAFSSLSVDGSAATYSSNGKKNASETNVERLVITPTSEIEQGSEVTFTFNGNVKITYIEVFGTSLEQCEAPEIVPYEYDAENGWSYQIIPAAGTTVNYTVAGGATQTSTTTVTVSAADIATGQVIKAWSTKDGMGGSERVTMTDANTIKPVIRFAPSASATYNKHNNSWVGGTAPTLEIFPSSLLSSVTYTTLDPTVGNGTNGTGTITIGDGQGVTTITASVTVNSVAGLTDGTYTKELTLTLADGFEDKLPKGYTPQVGGTRQVNDETGNLLLTLGFGGWTHGSNGSTWYDDGNPNTEDKSNSKNKQADKWPTTSDYTGETGAPATKIDGYIWQSQAETDARSETKGNIEWETKYQKVKPYSLPCRGAYITVTPEKNGKLTIYLVQNGSINESGSSEGTISTNPRVYYWFDSEGNCIPADAVTVTQPIYFTPDKDPKSKGTFKSQVLDKWKVNLDSRESSENKELYDALTTHWSNLAATDIEHPIPYQGGYFLMKKAYIKYVITLLAGKTYYFFSNGSKMGYSGLNFAPSDEVSIKLPEGGTQTVSTVESLALNDTETFTAPSTTTSYNEVTLNRTFKPGVWNTICLPISVSKEQVERVFGKGTVFVGYNGFSENTLHLVYHAYDYILPGQPYFIKPTGEGVEMNDGVIDNIVFKGVTITSNTAVKDNDGKDDSFQFIGLFNGATIQPYDHYMGGSGNIVFSSTKSIALKGYRAYLKNNTGGAAQVKAVAYTNFDDDMDDPTAIDDLMVYLENEGVQVIPIAGVYNLNGQKIADDATNLPAGIYIIKGKKVVVK